MNAEPRRVTKSEGWAQREGQVVNGIFPLRRFLGGSSHSAVFLTEYKAENRPDVAIKFVPADTIQTEAQLVQWGAVATLSHSHLVRIFDVGRCQFGGRGCLFVVMEYAEQTLAQILPQRALSPDEVQELLLPTLDAMAFLHRNQLVHGRLKPSNFLVVDDQLKLASDTARAIGGPASTAGDVWSLGMTLFEALTQYTPDDRRGAVSLPTSIPAQLADTVQRCLSLKPADRPTVSDLETQYKPAPPAQAESAPPPEAREVPTESAPTRSPPKRHALLPVIAAVLLISLGAFVGVRYFQKDAAPAQVTSVASQARSEPAAASPAAASPAAPAAATAPTADPAAAGALPTESADGAPPVADVSTPAEPAAEVPASTATAAIVPAGAAPADPTTPAPSDPAISDESASNASSSPSLPSEDSSPPPADPSPSVLHEVSPDVSRVIRDRIHGHIHITVRVLVDPSGNVVGEFVENRGPSRYFARLASEAAEQWKFAPADIHGSRVWLLRFEFNRTGATVHATSAK